MDSHKVIQCGSKDLNDLDSLIFALQAVRQEVGANIPLSISILQETPGNPFGTFYEDRTISPDLCIVDTGNKKFIELYV